jgi:hypothetical protein
MRGSGAISLFDRKIPDVVFSRRVEGVQTRPSLPTFRVVACI